MKYTNAKNVQDIRITVTRLPLSDCTNVIMPKITNAKEKRISPRKTRPTKKYEVFKNNIHSKTGAKKTSANNRVPQLQIVFDKIELNSSKSDSKIKNKTSSQGDQGECSSNSNELQIVLEKSFDIDCLIKSSDILNKSAQKQKAQKIKESVDTKLGCRLKRFSSKDYFESSLEESIIKNDQINTSKPKVPIYNQTIPTENKSKTQDPYALDVSDSEKQKPKRKKNINMNKKKKIIKKKVLIKSSQKYSKNINKVLNRVMSKIREKNDIIENAVSIQKHKEIPTTITSKCVPDDKLKENICETVTGEAVKINATNITQRNNKVVDQKQIVFKDKIGIDSSIGFLGFTNNPNTSKNQLNTPSNLYLADSSHNDNVSYLGKSIQNHSFITNSDIKYHSTPSTRKSQKINVVSNISLNSKAQTSRHTDLIEKSQHLQKEFQNNTVFNNESLLSHKNYPDDDYHNNDCLDIDDNEEESDEEDECFGFQECTDISIENVNIQKRHSYRPVPWRFQGFFKRNPYNLILKKNGLPCKQQEMVIDYEFVKRIENLSAKNVNKVPKPARPKSPQQTTLLDFIETDQEHSEHPVRQSLFNYEDFIIDKPARTVLGVIHDNNQIVSTPKKDVQSVIPSPNISIIPINEENDNSLRRSYRRRKIVNNEDDKNQDDDREEELMPSILEKYNGEVDNDDLHLFEEIEDKMSNHSIQLPIIKYTKTKTRARKISETSNNHGEKKSKRKKKDMMTKDEEAAFEEWVAKTNARFEEEDKHELTIE